MPMPRISVIVPCFNQVRFIERTLCSVLDQGYENLELLVIDGGSQDGSVDLIRLYADELAYWVSEADGGRSDAINKGLARATGDILAVLNGDDLYLPGALHEVAGVMNGPGAPNWLVGRCCRIGEHDQSLGAWETVQPRSLAAFLRRDSGFLPSPSTFFAAPLVRERGHFDDRLRFAFDYEYACRLLVSGRTPTLISTNLAAHREHADRKSADITLQAGLECIEVAQRYAYVLPLPQRAELWANCDQRRRIYTLAQAEMRNHAAKRYLLMELLKHPWWLTAESIRRVLRFGVTHPLPPEMSRNAA